MKARDKARIATRGLVWIALWIAGILGLALSAGMVSGASPTERAVRQIGVMESIIDQVLIDSPNFLVSGRDNARGLYIDSFGAIFSFDASLVSSRWMDLGDMMSSIQERFDVTENEKGEKVIVIREKEVKKDKAKEAEKKSEKAEEKKDDSKARYEAGKDEMIQTLLDYGETMNSLRDDHSIVIAAFMKGRFLVKEKSEPSRLVVKAKVKDLRDYSAGRLSEKDTRSRIVVEEY